MKQLNKLQSLIFLTGGAMMVVGAGCFALMWQQKIACWIYLAGALMFGVMQMMQEYGIKAKLGKKWNGEIMK